MDVSELKIDTDKALELYRKYEAHKTRQTPADAEIESIYKHIASGKTVIRALESIREAGLNAQGFPKLAIAPAHFTDCWWRADQNTCTFGKRWIPSNAKHNVVRMDWAGLGELVNQANKPGERRWDASATVPLIPIHLRPRRGLQNYHILWEAEWTKRYPIDPYLLRRFGGDAWVVVAAWDLTDVERAVMSSRLSS